MGKTETEDHGFMPAQTKKITRTHLYRKNWIVAHTCHSSYGGNYKQEDCSPGKPGQEVRAYLKNNQKKKGWRHALSGRVPAYKM
jgi:hypothetical protein